MRVQRFLRALTLPTLYELYAHVLECYAQYRHKVHVRSQSLLLRYGMGWHWIANVIESVAEVTSQPWRRCGPASPGGEVGDPVARADCKVAFAGCARAR